MFRYLSEEGVNVFTEKQFLPAVRNLATKLILSGKTESVRGDLWPLEPSPAAQTQQITLLWFFSCIFCRWASHLRSPFIRHTKKRVVGSAETGGCDKVEGVSNEISPSQICLVISSFSLVVEKLSAFLMPGLCMLGFCILFSQRSSEQNEYKVNKAAVRRTGDILCKFWCFEEDRTVFFCVC